MQLLGEVFLGGCELEEVVLIGDVSGFRIHLLTYLNTFHQTLKTPIILLQPILPPIPIPITLPKPVPQFHHPLQQNRNHPTQILTHRIQPPNNRNIRINSQTSQQGLVMERFWVEVLHQLLLYWEQFALLVGYLRVLGQFLVDCVEKLEDFLGCFLLELWHGYIYRIIAIHSMCIPLCNHTYPQHIITNPPP